jgi:catechol 2,3-dioxygenase-like lactoylglutathione lyase family enzyme
MNRPIHTVVAVILLSLIAPLASAQTTRPAVSAVLKIGITVSDMDRSLVFYTSAFGFRAVSDTEVAGDAFEHLTGVFGARARIVELQLGQETIQLTQYLAPQGKPIPLDSRSNDRWFQHIAIVTTDMDQAYARLRAAKVKFASSGPQTLPDWNPDAGGIKAFYFKDPDDHVLETIWFPAGKGDPRWQGAAALFPGIDHTAIVVEDTDRSLAFYRDTLGMRFAGESHDFGTEQEHLNNVFGANLRITALRAASGPGVEFLEYLAPRDGRPFQSDAKANDLVHWQTTLVSPDAAGLLHDLQRAGYRLVSTGTVPAQSPFIVRDPDGHAVQIVSPKTASQQALNP